MTSIQSNMAVVTDLKKMIQMERVEYSPQMMDLSSLLSHETINKPLISVSSTTAALVADAENTFLAIRQYLDDRGVQAEIIRTGCLGICTSEPLVGIQLPGKSRLFFRNIDPVKVPLLLDDVFHKTIPEEFFLGQWTIKDQVDWDKLIHIKDLPFFQKQKRILLAESGILDPSSIEEYIARGGYKSFLKTIRNYTYQDICDIILESGLRGRSGSGFLTGEKWKIAYSTPADQKYLICNAEESDPGAFMDRAIMEGNPHLLIEGMCIAAYAIGASKAFIYIRSEYGQSIKLLENAIQRAHAYGLLGHNIFESGFNLDIILRKGPGAFVCGEETALIKSLEGRFV